MPCLSSSAVSALNDSIRVWKAPSQLAVPFMTTTFLGSRVNCSPKGSAVWTGAIGGGAGVWAAEGVSAGDLVSAGGGTGDAAGAGGAGGGGAGAGGWPRPAPPHPHAPDRVLAAPARPGEPARCHF